MKQFLSTEQIQKEIEACLQGKQSEEGPCQIDLTKSLEQNIKQDLSGRHYNKLEKFQVLKTAENIFNRKKEKSEQQQGQNHETRFSASSKYAEGLLQPEDSIQSDAQHKQSTSSEMFTKEKNKAKYEEIMQDPEFQQVYKVYPDNITKNILIYIPQNETNQHKFQPHGNKERLQEIKDINQQIRKLQKNIVKEYEEMFKQDEQEQQEPENFEFVTNIPGLKQESLNDSMQEKIDDENAEQPEEEEQQLIHLTKPITKQPFKKKKQKIYLNFEELKKQQFQNICISTTSHKVPSVGKPGNPVEHLQRVYNKENTKTYPYNFVKNFSFNFIKFKVQQFRTKKLNEQNILQVYMKNQRNFMQGAFNYLPKQIQFFTKKHMLKMQQSSILNQQQMNQLTPEQLLLIQEQTISQHLSSHQTESNEQVASTEEQPQLQQTTTIPTLPYQQQSFKLKQKQVQEEFKNVIKQNNHKNGLQYKMDKLLAGNSQHKRQSLTKPRPI